MRTIKEWEVDTIMTNYALFMSMTKETNIYIFETCKRAYMLLRLLGYSAKTAYNTAVEPKLMIAKK